MSFAAAETVMHADETEATPREQPNAAQPARREAPWLFGFKLVVGLLLGVHTTMLAVGVLEGVAWHAGVNMAVLIAAWPLGPILALSSPIVAILAFVTCRRAFVFAGVTNLLFAVAWCALVFAALCQL